MVKLEQLLYFRKGNMSGKMQPVIFERVMKMEHCDLLSLLIFWFLI